MRKQLWSKISSMTPNINKAWLLSGDFNEIKDVSEKKGGANIDKKACTSFANWINDCGLIDLRFIGSRFTWRGPQWEGQERVFKRLDRALANADWRTKFQEAKVEVLPRIGSDHHPLLITLQSRDVMQRRDRPFRYEAMWEHQPNFKEFVKQEWNINQNLNPTLYHLKGKLQDWNKDTFGNIFKQKRKIMNRLKGIQRHTTYGKNKFLDRLEANLHQEMEEILKKEEIFWFQKSRAQWIVEGDRNTKFYHTKTIIRRAKNKISKLRNQQGEWIENGTETKDHAVQFFKDLYQDEVNIIPLNFTAQTSPKIDSSFCRNLIKTPTLEETKKAVFSIGSLKAPGRDGFPALFFKRNWEIVENKMMEHVTRCWNNPEEIEEANTTLITLIPKIQTPEFITQFRPIALCNVNYKVITKILVNRIKPTLNDIIAPYQSSFVPGRNIQDNIIIAKEVMHSMKRMRGKAKFMAIKIDFEKAYDRINWDFLEKRLLEINMLRKCVGIIMKCVRTVKYNLLWNGSMTEEFSPKRGIRQGDPISPYLFVICMDALSQLIEKTVELNNWKPFTIGRRGPKISHLLFADDLLIFAEATPTQLQNVIDTMNTFCNASGLKINQAKTSIVFTRNVSNQIKQEMYSISGFKESKELGRYLGAMINNNRKGKDNYKDVMDRVQNKLKGWKSNCLSLAGRITLAQAAISPMLNYEMQHNRIPKGICNDIEKIQRKFIWGDEENKRKMHLVS
ncbi:hypothetical protein Ahy_A09g045127 isoform B [Arachis hypogaea]|nr:hypothetical protein Ahy_A09g045127 isoform B [Arachis hypogaea]